MTVRHTLDRGDVDLGLLTEEVSARLGHPVALAAGSGVLVVIGPATGEHLDVDEAAVASAVAEHVPPAPDPDPLQQLETALTGATTVAKLREALTVYVGAERRRRERARPV